MVDDWDDTALALPDEIDLSSTPRKGYLIVFRGNNIGQTYPVLAGAMVIGRAAGSDLRLDDEGISRFHCKLRHEGDDVVIEDLGSRNGTYCNGERVFGAPRRLVEGDRLQIGTTCVLRFTYAEAQGRETPFPEETGIHDPLTGVFSRRYFMEQLENEVTGALQHRMPLSLLLIHIDRFKELRHEPAQADELIIGASMYLRDRVQPENLLARIADADFALMMRSSSPGDTFMLAERLRASGARIALTDLSAPEHITFSLGLAAIGEVRVESAHDLLLAAGSALHRARSLGGNRIVMCTQDLLSEPRGRARV